MTTSKTAVAMGRGRGHLLVVGGGEERTGDMRVLSRFVELCGGPESSIVVLTAASAIPDKMWDLYDSAFGELGVQDRTAVSVGNRRQADDPTLAARIMEADGIFMSGGDQQRLVDLVGGSKIHGAMQQAFRQRGACIGGTSAGASAMSQHMLAHGTKDVLPDKHTAQLAAGLGFLQHVVIDQHFSERQRLARLLSAVAQNPHVIGVGIDEDTALVIGGQNNVEVVGAGAVTLLDGRHMATNARDAEAREQLELINVTLHLLAAGNRYTADPHGAPPVGDDASRALRDTLAVVIGK